MDFDKKANIWDSPYRIDRAQIIANEIIKNSAPNKDMVAMEFGCGTGLVGLNIIDKLNSLYFVDNSQGMLDVLNTKIENSTIKNAYVNCIELHTTHAELPLFDMMFTSMALHHIPDAESLLTIFYNKLKNNGKLCIVDLNKEDGSFHSDESGFKGHNGFEQKDLQNMLFTIGYKNIESYTFLKDKRKRGDSEVFYSLFVLTASK